MARAFLTSSLIPLGCSQGSVDDARLMVSEAVANAIEHGRAPIHLSVTSKFTRVEVEVYDSDPTHLELPRCPVDYVEGEIVGDDLDSFLGTIDEDMASVRLSESGRGLDLISNLSDGRCGWRSRPPGKVVWFSAPVPIDPGPSAIELRIARPGSEWAFSPLVDQSLRAQIQEALR
ncbi:ATP-binding protein [Nocardiopsis gilva]|uniref:ATP-binding protein n=1 Tax=Nocardiopsis gilva TaxID=280236 RepID=UPI0012FE04C7|nr:ATP-binding protein [Nocardiopsis gilva]